MVQKNCPITSIERIAVNTYVLGFLSPEIAERAQAGQFLNIKVNDSLIPLFRRPFSIYRAEKETVYIIFQVFGAGTKALIQKSVGDMLDVLGPLGIGYRLDGNYETAILVGGGLGVAPLPVITRQLPAGKTIATFLGGRTKEQIVPEWLHNVHVATDDGSEGYKGTIVALLEEYLRTGAPASPKIFACGPNKMLAALGDLASAFSIPCEVSLETAMACGIGICQGCPVERVESDKKYSLVCKEGPVYDVKTVRFPSW